MVPGVLAHASCLLGARGGEQAFVWQVAVIYKERRSFFGNAL